MLRLLKWLFTGTWTWHEHQWETIENKEITQPGFGPVGICYVIRCKECGWVTFRRCGY